MPARDFFDTNILIYSFAGDADHTNRAEKLLERGGRISVQSLNECVAVCRRKFRMSWDEIREILQIISLLCPDPIPISLKIHTSAVAIAEKYGYKFYDSLIVAAALDAGCTTLYSEDLQDGQTINKQLTIRNPFG
ncbi:MAG TPA: PIN domain-containing protein [Terriglobales bacterium]|nr:PIN domain-containing protein [Terriglobales bacterium]